MKTPPIVGKLVVKSSESTRKSKATGKQHDEDTSILNEVFHDCNKQAQTFNRLIYEH